MVRAHTIQRSGGLTRIARDGHVYAWRPDLLGYMGDDGPFKPALLGIRQASTFTGFCQGHDNETFMPIEDCRFSGTREQAFLLGYRAICRELYGRELQYESLDLLRTADRGRSQEDQRAIQAWIASFAEVVSRGLSDTQVTKQKFDELVLSGNYETVRALIIETSAIPEVQCSGAILPECDFSGQKLLALDADEPLAHVTFSSIATDRGGAFIFSWLGDDDASIQLVDSLNSLSDEELPEAILAFVFEFFENVCIAPSWWDSLEPDLREAFVNRWDRSMDPSHQRDPRCLVQREAHAAYWPIARRIRMY